MAHRGIVGTELGTKGAETQRKILAAATALFSKKGVVTTSMEDIAAMTGITKPAIYNYFSSKQEILDRIIGDLNAEWRAKEQEIMRSSGSLRDRLLRLAKLDTAIDADLLWVLLSAAAMDAFDDKGGGTIRSLREYIAEFVASLTAMLEKDKASGQLKPHADPRSAALTFLSMLSLFMLSHERTALDQLFTGDSDQLAEFVVDTFLHGVAAD